VVGAADGQSGRRRLEAFILKPLFNLQARRLEASRRCFCFPHAGGGRGAFLGLRRLLHPKVDLLPLELPGREARFGEAPYVEFEALMQDLLVAVKPLADREFALLGHSLGALVAYELACRLQREYGIAPVHLLLSGTRPPHFPRPASATLSGEDHRLDDICLLERLRAFGGIPDEIAVEREMAGVALATVRTDLRIYESYRPPAGCQRYRVRCPITMFGGIGDLADVPEQSLREWAGYTLAGFRLHLLPGNHFFLYSHNALVAATLLEAFGCNDWRLP